MVASGPLCCEAGRSEAVCSAILSAPLLWHAERLVLVPSRLAPRRRQLRERASGTRPHCTARPGLPKEIADLIWVAALLLVDCDDLVGRGVCWPRRRDMKEV